MTMVRLFNLLNSNKLEEFSVFEPKINLFYVSTLLLSSDTTEERIGFHYAWL